MAEDSLPPPPPGNGGGSKILIALLLLVGGGLGVYFATRGSDEAAAPSVATPAPVEKVERNTSLADNTLEIPDVLPEPEPAKTDEPQPTTPKKTATKSPGDAWDCAGDVAPKDITKVLNEHQSAIRSCYERQLRNDNALQGSIKLQVRIGADGSVAGTRISGTLNDKEVRECIQSIAKRWSFPSPTGASCAVFDAPYNFMPKN